MFKTTWFCLINNLYKYKYVLDIFSFNGYTTILKMSKYVMWLNRMRKVWRSYSTTPQNPEDDYLGLANQEHPWDRKFPLLY